MDGRQGGFSACFPLFFRGRSAAFRPSSAVKAVDLVHEAAGSSANYTDSPLNRSFRDVHVVPQHIMVSPQWMNVTGRVLLGLESGSPLL